MNVKKIMRICSHVVPYFITDNLSLLYLWLNNKFKKIVCPLVYVYIDKIKLNKIKLTVFI